MKTRLLALMILVVLMLSMVTATACADKSGIIAGMTVIVNNPDPEDRLNLRTQPREDAPTLGKYYNGTYVQALSDERDGWLKVRLFDLEGYMMAQFLVTQDQLPIGAATVPTAVISNGNGTGLNLRREQSITSPTLGLYPNGASVRVFGVSEDWCHVQTTDGLVGFMLREQLSPVLEYQKSGSASPSLSGTATVDNPNSLDRLNLRTWPSSDAPTLGRYYSGTVVEVLSGDAGGWTQVRFHGLEGYMMTQYLAFGQDQLRVGQAMPTVTIANAGGTGLNLRQEPATGSPTLGLYRNGDTVCVYGVSEDWCHVQTSDGNFGFMLREALSPAPEYVRVSAPTGDELEGSWFGKPGDPVTGDPMPGGNG